MKRTAQQTAELMAAYEIVGNDLDQRGLEKLANFVDKVMERVGQEAGQGQYPNSI